MIENKNFETVEQVLEDPKCCEFITTEIGRMRQRREKAQSGGQLKRTAWNYLDEKWMLGAGALCDEFRHIIHKDSKLPSAARSFISEIVLFGMKRTIAYYNQKEENETRNTKKGRPAKRRA